MRANASKAAIRLPCDAVALFSVTDTRACARAVVAS
jgi:hypothetical protein